MRSNLLVPAHKTNWQLVSHYLRPVSCLGSKGFIHHVFDGEARHGALSEGNDLIDAFHHGVQLGVSPQRELCADLKTKESRAEATLRDGR